MQNLLDNSGKFRFLLLPSLLTGIILPVIMNWIISIVCCHNLHLKGDEVCKCQASDQLAASMLENLGTVGVGAKSLWNIINRQSWNVSTIYCLAGDEYLSRIYLVVREISGCHIIFHLQGVYGQCDNCEPWVGWVAKTTSDAKYKCHM